MYTFDSFVEVGELLSGQPTEVVKNEPMFFNADYKFAWQNGGPITQNFLNVLATRIPPSDIIFDSRVHMLMPGWWPCIPGWHHDDVPRAGHLDGQPDYDTPEYRSQHAMALVGDPIACTEFALGSARFSRPRKGEVAYKVWHPQVDAKLEQRQLKRWVAPMHRIVYFNDRAWHQGVQSTGAGWRWFGRASWRTSRVPTNEIRRQVQVYMEHPMEGW